MWRSRTDCGNHGYRIRQRPAPPLRIRARLRRAGAAHRHGGCAGGSMGDAGDAALRHRRGEPALRSHQVEAGLRGRARDRDGQGLRQLGRQRSAGHRRIRVGPRPREADARHARDRGPPRIRRRCARHSHDQRAPDASLARRGIGHPRRAVRTGFGGAVPGRRPSARRRSAEKGDPCLAHLAHQDHGAARHRGEAPAAGRPHHLARGWQAHRRARLHAAHRSRRARGVAAARQGGRAYHAAAARHERRRAGAIRSPDQPAARHRSGHRPHRLGQDHHVVRGPVAVERRHEQHPDRRRSDRVRPAGRRADASQSAYRHDVRQGAALDPASGPGHHHDRRDPGPRNGADRRAGIAHRPPRARHPAHQRFRGGRHAAARHGHRVVPAVVVAAGCGRAAIWCASSARECRVHDGQYWQAAGCPKCGHTGYLGRVGIYELLLVTDAIRVQIHTQGFGSRDTRRGGAGRA